MTSMKGQDCPAPGSRDDVMLTIPPRGSRLAMDAGQGARECAASEGGSGHGPSPSAAAPSVTAQVSLSASASVRSCTGRVLLNLVALCALTLGAVLCTVLSTAPNPRIDLFLPSTLAPSLSSSLSSAFAPLRSPGLMLSQKTVSLPDEGRGAALAAAGAATSLEPVTWQREAVVDQVVRDVLFFPPSPGGLGPGGRDGEGLEEDRVVVFGDACGHSRKEVAEILLQPHGWEQGAPLAVPLLLSPVWDQGALALLTLFSDNYQSPSLSLQWVPPCREGHNVGTM